MRCMPRLLDVVDKEFGRLLPRAVEIVVKAALIEVMVVLVVMAALAVLRAVMVAIDVLWDAVAGQKRRSPSSFRLLVLRAHANQLIILLPEAHV